MATDAASGWVRNEMERGVPKPTASDIKDIHPNSTDGFDNLLVLNIKNDRCLIDKNLPIINFFCSIYSRAFSRYNKSKETNCV